MLALAMLLSQQRPVELHAVIALGTEKNGAGIITVRIPSAPLELATACYTLTSAAFPRELGYRTLEKEAHTDGSWAWGIHPFGSNAAKYADRMRAALGLAPHDLFLPPPHLDAMREPIIANPIKWINDELAKLGALVDSAA